MRHASVIVPFQSAPRPDEVEWLASLAQAPGIAEVLVAAPTEPGEALRGKKKVKPLVIPGGRGAQLRGAIARTRTEQVILQEPHTGYDPRDYAKLLAPLGAEEADAVYGNRFGSTRSVSSYFQTVAGNGLRFLSNAVTNLALKDPDCGVKAFGGPQLRALKLTSEDQGIDAELTFKIAAQFYRVFEVPLHYSAAPPRDNAARMIADARTLLRYAASANDADNLHEGYNTLLRMDSAPNYNAWLGRKLRAHLGKRVLEVGAGIGTITRQIEQGRELVLALEVDPFYVEKLKNLFKNRPHVKPFLSGVESADWDKLKPHQIDSIVLSNVLEHIADDAGAVANFKRVLVPGGRLVVLVPALPQLFGTIDEAVGHFRRYTPATLRAVLEGQGFTVEALEWINLVGIPGWFMNGRILKRRAVPALQLKLYDTVSPLLAGIEDRLPIPVGMSLMAVARI
jgi:SAM-dependent methyltransferase